MHSLSGCLKQANIYQLASRVPLSRSASSLAAGISLLTVIMSDSEVVLTARRYGDRTTLIGGRTTVATVARLVCRECKRYVRGGNDVLTSDANINSNGVGVISVGGAVATFGQQCQLWRSTAHSQWARVTVVILNALFEANADNPRLARLELAEF